MSAEEVSATEKAVARASRPGLAQPALTLLVILAVGALAYALFALATQPGDVPPSGTVAIVRTNVGTFEILLNTEAAPNTTAHFIQLVQDGFYDNLTFHRVIEGFIIQGGGHDSDLNLKPSPYPDIPLEISANLTNARGTVAMAHKPNESGSANTQFFVNLADNTHLDPGVDPIGFAVFGRIISGMDVVDAIGEVETHTVGTFENVPVNSVVINSITIEIR